MKLNVLLQSQNTPFEGDCILNLRGLPANAVVMGASARVTPSEAEEVVSLEGPAPLPWGVTRDGNIVDFHARRILRQARLQTGQTTTKARVRVDMGGLWVAINNDGSIAVPDQDNQLFTVTNRAVDTRGVATPRLQVIAEASEAILPLSSVTWRSLPSNVSLRLSEQGPFLFVPGDLRAEVSSPDFSDALSAYLRTATTENGQYVVPIVLHSDTIARLDVAVEIEYTLQQDVMPPAVKEVAVQYTWDPLPQGQKSVVDVLLPANARVIPGLTTARVRGSFDPDRIVYGSTDLVDSANNVRVSAGTSFAMRVQVPEDLTASTIDLYVQPVSRTARLTLTLQDDAGGKPFGPALMPQANLTLSPQPDGMAWKVAHLPREFQFNARRPDNRPRSYWLVVQLGEGEVDWGIVPSEGSRGSLLYSQDNHLTWQEYRSPLIPGAVNGLFRLRWTPPLFTVPIQAMIGEGEAAQKVSLDRYQPQGRIDFRLDFPEIAQAFNRYLDAKNADTCPRVENLANAEFEDWTRIGDSFGEPQAIPFTSGQPLALALTPNGDRLLVGVGSQDQVTLHRYDGYQPNSIDTLILESEITAPFHSPEAIQVTPDGRLALVTCWVVPSSVYLFLVDLETFSQVGQPVQIHSMDPRQPSRSIALSPDGTMLYTGSDFYISGNPEGEIRRYEMHAFEQALRASGQPDIAERITLDGGAFPAAVALSSDGNRLFVITSQGSLYGYQTRPFNQVFGPFQVGENGPWNLALINQGSQVVVTNASTNTLLVIDTITGRLVSHFGAGLRINKPVGLTITQDERLALVSNGENCTIHAIDLTTQNEVSRAALSAAPGALALSLPERLIFIASSNAGNHDLTVLPFGVPALEDWTLTAGYLLPSLYPMPFHLAAILGAPTPVDFSKASAGLTVSLDTDSGLSQVVQVTTGCTYALNFWGIATNRAALAEVLWRSPACGQVRRDEIHFEAQEEQNTLPGEFKQASLPDLKPHHANLVAPQGATQAEIRFTTPRGVCAIVDRASFMSAPALANGNLQTEEDGVLAGWQLEPPDAPGIYPVAGSTSVSLRNMGTAQAVLKQRLPLIHEKPFQLIFHGARGTSGAANPRIEVAYLNAAGHEVSPASGFEVERTGPPEQKIEATTPAGTTQVEVRLVLPAGSALEVVELTLDPLLMVRVPVTFLSQTMGELVVSDFRVAYELVEPAPLAAPAEGLCTATPPGQQPGEAPHDTCYCPCCHAEREMTLTANVTTASGRSAVSGTCRTCGTSLTRIGGPQAIADTTAPPADTATAGLRVIRIWGERPGLAPRPAPAPPPAAPTEPAQPDSVPGIIAVRGIGRDMARRLEGIGITTLEALAAAQPETLIQVRGISREKAADFIREARRLQRQATRRGGK